MRPDDLPSAADLAEGKPHGTRIRYLSRCRCMLCRAANARYETERAAARRNGDWNGLVPADRARRHLQKLSRSGVGRRSVADACDVALTVIAEIKAGRQKQIRARTERRILSVTRAALSGGGIISAGRTWKIISWLQKEGFSKAEIARRLGYASRAIQFRKDKIQARTTVKIERFYNRIMLEMR